MSVGDESPKPDSMEAITPEMEEMSSIICLFLKFPRVSMPFMLSVTEGNSVGQKSLTSDKDIVSRLAGISIFGKSDATAVSGSDSREVPIIIGSIVMVAIGAVRTGMLNISESGSEVDVA